jgi:hypothetical protein
MLHSTLNKSLTVEEYQDGENSNCEFFGLVPFLHLAIHLRLNEN